MKKFFIGVFLVAVTAIFLETTARLSKHWQRGSNAPANVDWLD